MDDEETGVEQTHWTQCVFDSTVGYVWFNTLPRRANGDALGIALRVKDEAVY